MLHFSKDDFSGWERFYRANLLNSLSGFKATHLVATVNRQGLPNLSLFHNVVHLGADPALIGMVNRPKTAAPHTLANIEVTGKWTMNSVHPDILEKAHQCSAKYSDGINEFNECGLTAEWKNDFAVPVVGESSIQYALSLVEIIPITHNQTFFIIGKIEHCWIREDLLTPDGFLQLEKAETVTSTGLDAYFVTQSIGRFAYAKPDLPPRKI
ncbi:MAG: flavin reductase [Chitinophagaceae bacterium]|nr:flavin reductase [Chitinophagaceae bacterium]